MKKLLILSMFVLLVACNKDSESDSIIFKPGGEFDFGASYDIIYSQLSSKYKDIFLYNEEHRKSIHVYDYIWEELNGDKSLQVSFYFYYNKLEFLQTSLWPSEFQRILKSVTKEYGNPYKSHYDDMFEYSYCWRDSNEAEISILFSPKRSLFLFRYCSKKYNDEYKDWF